MGLLELTESQLQLYDWAPALGVKNLNRNIVQETLKDLRPRLGSALVIGGLAVMHHGYERFTNNVDLLYSRSDEDALLARLDDRFKKTWVSETGWHRLEHRSTKFPIKLVPENWPANYGVVPGPQHFQTDDGFIPLWGLVWTKLISDRSKDTADIVELIKRNLNKDREIRERLHCSLDFPYDLLVLTAKKEIENDLHNYPEGMASVNS